MVGVIVRYRVFFSFFFFFLLLVFFFVFALVG